MFQHLFTRRPAVNERSIEAFQIQKLDLASLVENRAVLARDQGVVHRDSVGAAGIPTDDCFSHFQ